MASPIVAGAGLQQITPFAWAPIGLVNGLLTKLKNAGSSPVNAMFWTDSVGQGAYADDWMNHSFVGYTAAYLKSKYGHYADYLGLSDTANGTLGGNASFGGTPPWVVNETAHAVNPGFGIGAGASLRWAGDSHPTATLATLTTPACTAIDIVYQNHYVGVGHSWTYTIDGDGGHTVNTVATDSILRRVRIQGLSNAAHTIVLSGQDVDNTFVIFGAACYMNDVSGAGMGIARLCTTGGFANALVAAGTVPSQQGYTFMSGTANVSPSPFGFPTAPDILFIQEGINDWLTAGRNLSGYIYSLSKAIESCRDQVPNIVPVLINVLQPDPNTSDVVTNTTHYVGYENLRATLYNLAATQRCVIIDYGIAMGSQPVANGWMDAAGHAPHLTTLGHNFVANNVIVPALQALGI